MSAIVAWLREPGSRGYVYRVLFALGALLLAYGILAAEQLAAWTALAAAMLGTGTAAWNQPTSAQLRGGKPDRHRGRVDIGEQVAHAAARAPRRKFER